MNDGLASENLTLTGSIGAPDYIQAEQGTVTATAGSAWVVFGDVFSAAPTVVASALKWTGGSGACVQTVDTGSALVNLSAAGSFAYIALGQR